MRMIDADNLNFQEQHYNKSQMKAILDFVDNQPTVYDIDRVVERLKKEAEYSHADYLEYAREHGFDEDADWHFSGLKRAVEIVESGTSLDGEHIRSDVEESAIKNHIMQRFMRKE